MRTPVEGTRERSPLTSSCDTRTINKKEGKKISKKKLYMSFKVGLK